jgi:hypothetical protein
LGFQPLACRNYEFRQWAMMFVSCECCVLSGSGLCVGLISAQRSPTECGVSDCDRENWLHLVQYTTDLLNMNSVFPVPSVKQHKGFGDERDFT